MQNDNMVSSLKSSSYENPEKNRTRTYSHRRPFMHPSSCSPLPTANLENDVIVSSSENLNDDHQRLPCEICDDRVKKDHRPHRHMPSLMHTTTVPQEDYDDVSATFSRYKFYSRLGDYRLRIPDHILPNSLFYVIPTKSQDRQSSIVTIFAIWNTMMGTSLLSMPWGLSQAGFGLGIFLIIALGLLTLYTAYIVIRSKDYLDRPVCEFSDVTRYYFGPVGEWLAFAFGIIAFIGGMLVYWVLMTNFLYMTGLFIHDKAVHIHEVVLNTSVKYPDAICHAANENTSLKSIQLLFQNSSETELSTFEKLWSVNLTVPLYLVVLVFPLLNFKSPTFFTKFNCLGTLSVLYLWALVITKAAKWGFHLNISGNADFPKVPQFVETFPALTGMLSLAFFLHNAVMTILSNNKNQQNNVRDLTVGYLLVMFTYLIVGILFFASFPLAKNCIAPVLFDNLSTTDLQAVIGRAFLFFQMFTVFPLLAYMIRVQTMYFFFGNPWPSLLHVLALNSASVFICVLFAIFFPHVGDIIRYSGSLCGLVYVFVLPSIVYMTRVYKRDGFKPIAMFLHSLIIAIGVANFISQFIIKPSK